jgi:tetratricopeptide (TPR) repeat protein
MQLFGYQGRAQSLEPLLERLLATGEEDLFGASAARAQFALERGERRQAAAFFDVVRRTGFQVPSGAGWRPPRFVTLVRVADVCAAIGDHEDAALLYAMLLPKAEACASESLVLSLGSFSRPLGELARVLGDHDRAEAHFRRALDVNQRFGHRPECARTRFGLGATLMARGRVREANAQLAMARAEALAMKMTMSSSYAEPSAAAT